MMKDKTLELIDFDRINSLLEGFNNSTGFVTAILDLDGKVLSKSGWRQICTEYHRIHPGTSQKCLHSDTVLAGKMAEGEQYHFYKCLNGLVDVAVPIVINGEHVANLFSGQFFFEPPNRQFFRKQAQHYGFNEDEYLQALDQVPVVSEEKVKLAMDFLLDLTHLITDLTMQNAKEKELTQKVKESETRYRLLVDNSPYAIGIDQDEKMVFANPATVNLFGAKSKEELIGKSIFELINPESHKEANERIVNILSGKANIFQWENHIIRLDGTSVPVAVTAAPLVHEGRPAIQIIATDLSERKRAEAQLKERHAILNALMESASTPVFSIDRDYRYTSFNSIHATVMKALYDVEIKIRTSFLEYLTNPEDREEAKRNLDRAIGGEQFVILAYSGDAGLSRRYFEIAHNPIRETNGDVIGVSVFASDITERKQAEEEISTLNAELEQRVIDRTAELKFANKELEAFSYSVSHDLRSPLRHINGYIELLKQDLQNDRQDEIQYYLDSVSRASLLMGKLIDDLLQFSRAGRQELHMDFQDMNRMVSELIAKMEIEIHNRNISWNIMPFPVVYGDSSMLTQVWANLLDNAVKYTGDKKNTEITIGFKEEAKEIVFFVQDNGVGFDMKYAHKLFGVFQRLHSKGDFEGTGIGLANVQRIINKHNGRVWAEAEKHKGATFYFSLPKKKQAK